MSPCQIDPAKCPIFRRMTDAQREAVAQCCEERTYSSGVSIVQEGNERPLGLWLIRSGTCAVLNFSPFGGEKQVNFLQSGDIFGENSFFDPQPHGATIRVVEELGVMYLPLTAMEQLRKTAPSAADRLMQNLGRIMAQKLRHLEERLFAELVITTASVPSGGVLR